MTKTLESSSRVVIVGAGPIGLLLANLLGKQGIEVELLEKRKQLTNNSMAIGISPVSLGILKTLDLDSVFIAQGCKIQEAWIYGDRRALLGSVEFTNLTSDYRYILTLPQAETIAILAENLIHYPRVKLRMGTEFRSIERAETGKITIKSFDLISNQERIMEGSFLVGCDGCHGKVCQDMQGGIKTHAYNLAFLMADFHDRTSLGNAAHLYFTAQGAVESFPLPGQKRRWIIQIEEPVADRQLGFFEESVRARTGVELLTEDKLNESGFQPEYGLVSSYYLGNCILCGDAAHVMSPIGGQGMNTGFADAELLAMILPRLLRDQESAENLLRLYDECRRKAFKAAARRARRGMWLGTRTGRINGLWRNGILKLLLSKPIRGWVATQFSMLTLPYCRAEKIPRIAEWK